MITHFWKATFVKSRSEEKEDKKRKDLSWGLLCHLNILEIGFKSSGV
jgi:hypothetical protein